MSSFKRISSNIKTSGWKALLTLSRLGIIFLTSPIQSLKQVSYGKFKILIRAIRYESPKQIAENFRQQLIYGDKHLSFNENIYPVYTKKEYVRKQKQNLGLFLDSDISLDFSQADPIISIILVFHNRAELSFACLQSITNFAELPHQLIIIDNASTDETSKLLDKIKGAKIIKNNENIHFLKACNQALNSIETDYILFLNNDTELLENSLKHAYETLILNEKYAAVGGKIILPNGKLQEAGSIVWNDGSCYGYGREQSPNLPEFNFRREVDYCSAAFLLTRTNHFKKHQGFDTLFEPAYYEETDYCLWLQQQGLKVIYEPKAVIRHFEFGSTQNENAIQLQKQNQQKFLAKHKETLRNHLNPGEYLPDARFASSSIKKKKILFIDDRVPHKDFGSGFPRANSILQTLNKLNYQVSIYPLNYPFEEGWEDCYRDIPPEIEILKGLGRKAFKSFIKSRESYYDFIWVSRIHNFKFVIPIIKKHIPTLKIIYDSEAIFAEREIAFKELAGKRLSFQKANKLISKEIELAAEADCIITVSPKDALSFTKIQHENIQVLGHALSSMGYRANFDERKNLLFVGNLNDDSSPNTDSVLWFINDIFPIIKKQIPEIELSVIGSNKADKIQEINEKDVHILGKQKDLTEAYNTHRIFIAPTRFASGIPYKIHEAAAHGIPVAATKVLGEQLGWENKKNIVLANTEKAEFAKAVITLYSDKSLWQSIQAEAYNTINKECSLNNFTIKIEQILNSL